MLTKNPVLRFKNDKGENFPDWESKKLGEIFSDITHKLGKNFDISLVTILAATQDQGVIPLNQLGKSIIRDSNNLFSYKLVKVGDFIISLRTFQGGIEYSLYEGIISPAYVILRVNNSFKINNIFFKYYFKSNQFIRYVNQNLNYSLRDGKSISYNQAAIYQIPIPHIEEQNKIGKFLKAVDDKIEITNQKLNSLKTYKRALMQQLFPSTH